MNTYCVRMFSHCSASKSFSAELSDLYRGDQRMIKLVSDFGNEATFECVGVERSNDEDNEILAWKYVPTAESVERNPRLKDYTLTVFND